MMVTYSGYKSFGGMSLRTKVYGDWILLSSGNLSIC